MKILVAFFGLLFLTSVSCAGQNGFNTVEVRKMTNNMDNHKRIQSYKNISTAPSFLKFRIFDESKTGSFIVVVENSDLAYLLAGTEFTKGGLFKSPGMYIPENFKEFVDGKYLRFLVDNEGGKQTVSIDAFPRNRQSKVEVSNEDLLKFLHENEVKSQLSFAKLGVSSEKELIDKCFDYDYSKNFGHIKEACEEYHLDLSMISLLIDLDYNVSRGDIVPIMTISKIKK